MRFIVWARPVPRPWTQMTQVSRVPGTNQAGASPSSPGTSTSRWSRPSALRGSPAYTSGVSQSLVPGVSLP